MIPNVICPQCLKKETLEHVLTAQSNQNIIYQCPNCNYTIRNIQTSKG